MKKTILIIINSILVISANAQSPILQWAKSMGGSSDDYGHSIAVDASGNVFTTGTFDSTVDFNPGPGITNLTSAGGSDIFISESGAAGNFIWALRIGASANDFAASIVLDRAGNIYITGYFQGTVDFDPGPGVYNMTAVASLDIFVLKLDMFGNLSWARSMGGTSGDLGASIAVDAIKNVYTTGLFLNTVDFDPGPGVADLISAGNNDIFISKLDSLGNFVWAKDMGGSSSDAANSIALDTAGNIYTTGSFSGTADFDPGAGVFSLTSPAGGSDIFVSKLDSAGNFVWAKQMGMANAFEHGTSITLDAQGNIYTTGNYMGIADFDPGSGVFNLTYVGSTDIFISKLDASGNFVWAKSIGGSSYDAGNAIATDAFANVYITGYFCDTADFDPGPGIADLSVPAADVSDIFLLKLDSSGNFLWADQFGGTTDDYGYAVTLDAANNIYTTGFFSATADFNPGAGIANLTSHGEEDIFVQKLSQPVSASAIKENTDNNYIRVYPNPANNAVNIALSAPVNNAVIEIYNSIGVLVYTKQTTGNSLSTIELREEAKGIYFIKVTSDNKIIAAQKIIKQ